MFAFATPPGSAPPTIRFEPVPGTPYGLAYVQVAPVTSGPAAGALAAGIASIVVALVMLCLGLAGAGPGWGALVAGAFAILAALFGVAGVAVGTATARRIPPPVPLMAPMGYGMPWATPPLRDGGVGGRGMAVAGRVCGYVGVGLAVVGFVLVLVAAATG